MHPIRRADDAHNMWVHRGEPWMKQFEHALPAGHAHRTETFQHWLEQFNPG